MEFAPGCQIQGMTPELLAGLMICDEVYRSWSTIMVVVHVKDGQHMRASLHYSGNAADIRTSTLPEGKVKDVAQEIAEALGGEYDVVLESDHLHIEYQPK
jgi:uncharacterized protein YcbK (DUF882 family)